MSAGALHPMNTVFCYFRSSLESVFFKKNKCVSWNNMLGINFRIRLYTSNQVTNV